MGLERLTPKVVQLIKFWEEQNIVIRPQNKREFDEIQNLKLLKLPKDFIGFYLSVNGMETLYPNEMDKEGFLFYPLEAITQVGDEFENSNLTNKEIFIFAEYMHKSWWYGVEVKDDENYVIGIIPDSNSFKPITNSLSNFIDLYIDNSTKLYDYS